jgi:hypothetical protein
MGDNDMPSPVMGQEMENEGVVDLALEGVVLHHRLLFRLSAVLKLGQEM